MQQQFEDEQTHPASRQFDADTGSQGVLETEVSDATLLTDVNAPAEASTLPALLEREARMRRSEDWMACGWAAAFMISMWWMANVSISDVPTLQSNLALCAGLMGLMGMGVGVQLFRRGRRRKASFMGTLARTHDVEQVGPLIHTLRVQNTTVRSLAKRTLIGLLPTLRANDAPLLGVPERTILLRQLSIPPEDKGYRDLSELFSQSAFRREVDLRVAILQGLQQVGGTREIAAVERLARGLPTTPIPGKVHAEIRAAAEECLPYLQIRANEQRASEQLLRASSAHAAPEDGLLRPLTERTDTLPEQLLRASETSS